MMSVIGCWTSEELKNDMDMNEKEIETFEAITEEIKAVKWLQDRRDAMMKGINKVCNKCGTYCYGDCKTK